MRVHSLTHVGDADLLANLATLVARERTVTAGVIAHVAEVEARRLYAPAGYPSMYEYCVRELRLSEQAAMKRIRAARLARRFPAILPAVADGRLHLSGLVLLAPYLTEQNGPDLLAASSSRTRAEIESLLAERFPRTELLPMAHAAPDAPTAHAASDVPMAGVEDAPESDEHDRRAACQLSPGTVEGAKSLPSNTRPLAAQRFELHLSIPASVHDKLEHARALLAHRAPAAGLAEVIDRALDALIGKLERRTIGATGKPRAPKRGPLARRTIPASVRRAVWRRDRGCCTFVSESGRRCPARARLQFDHIVPVARGGAATIDNLRLLCRAHNQLQAERTFGAAFMRARRESTGTTRPETRSDRASARRTAAAARTTGTGEPSATPDPDVVACLRSLGLRPDESRRAAVWAAERGGATLEDRVRHALSNFRPRVHARIPAPVRNDRPAVPTVPGDS